MPLKSQFWGKIRDFLSISRALRVEVKDEDLDPRDQSGVRGGSVSLPRGQARVRGGEGS